MRIITWNANRADRWNQLWADPLVSNLQWDIICLQEVGNPDVANWTHASGPVWNPAAAQRATDESFTLRRYTYQPPLYPNALHIIHTEWANRQKNHLVIITQTRANWVAELGGDMSDRPAVGIKARLAWGANTRDVLVGCVHIVAAPLKAPQEISAMVPMLNRMSAEAHAQGWMLVGDMNCGPTQLRDGASEVVGFWHPTFSTQDSVGEAIDYLVVEPNLYQTVMAIPAINGAWTPGTAASDHKLVKYTQVNGPALQIL